MLIDTHCHLFMSEFASDRESVMDHARKAGVEAFVNVGIDAESSRQAIALSESERDSWATVGLHPHSAHTIDESVFRDLEGLATHCGRVVAIGESGLDYVKSEATREKQREVFGRMADLGGRLKLPLVVHSREAFEDTIKVLRDARLRHPDLRGVFHCYTYGPEELKDVLELGFFVSFTGIVTFPNAAKVQEAARQVPLNRLLVETDSPYLAPQPVRGARNEPAHVRWVLRTLAALKNIPEDEAARRTTENARGLFGLKTEAL